MTEKFSIVAQMRSDFDQWIADAHAGRRLAYDTPLTMQWDGCDEIEETTLRDFLEANEFDVAELTEVLKALALTGEYVDGGGASPIVTVKIKR